MTKKGRTEERMVDSEMSGGIIYRYALICVILQEPKQRPKHPRYGFRGCFLKVATTSRCSWDWLDPTSTSTSSTTTASCDPSRAAITRTRWWIGGLNGSCASPAVSCWPALSSRWGRFLVYIP